MLNTIYKSAPFNQKYLFNEFLLKTVASDERKIFRGDIKRYQTEKIFLPIQLVQR